jgi:hypothetical protein
VTRRIAPREAELVIAGLRAANPIRREATRRPPDQVDAFLLHVMERTEMVQDKTRTVGSPRDGSPRRPIPRWIGFAAGLGLVVLVALPLLLVNSGPNDPALEGLSASQARVVEKLVDAVNSEDFEGFRVLFADEGSVAFETGFLSQPHFEGVAAGQSIAVSDEAAFEADFFWGAIIDRRLTPMTCTAENDRIVLCEITSTMGTFRTEWVERLSMGLTEDGRISLLSTEPLDVDPVDREQPLNLIEFLEGFDRWLQGNHPDEFERLVRPGTRGEINGVETPLDPDLIDDLTALIDEYVASR